MHATPQVITSAMQLYFTGESFRNVQKFLKLQGVNVSHTGVYKWINKYVKLVEKYLDKIKPNVSFSALTYLLITFSIVPENEGSYFLEI